jgi:hypothetical protein
MSKIVEGGAEDQRSSIIPLVNQDALPFEGLRVRWALAEALEAKPTGV